MACSVAFPGKSTGVSLSTIAEILLFSRSRTNVIQPDSMVLLMVLEV